jgi:hypothetical protein
MPLTQLVRSNKGFLIALLMAAWLGLEAGGKGTGLFQWLFSPGLTRDQGFHPMDVIGGRLKGPVRLSKVEADAANARLAEAFGTNVAKHERTSRMRHLYELKADARCPVDRSDLVECNKLQRVEVFFAAVLGEMHPATEHLLWLERRSYPLRDARDLPIRVAVFVGSDGQTRLAFDLRRVKSAAELQAFSARFLSQMGDLRELRAREVKDGVLIVDDPKEIGAEGGSASVRIYSGGNRPEYILSLPIEGDLVVRHRFFSALLGKPVGEAAR